MAEKATDRPSPFEGSFEPESHEDATVVNESTSMEQGVWDTEDGLLGAPGDESSNTTVAARKGPNATPQVGRNAPDE
jgi:hypothetical protein